MVKSIEFKTNNLRRDAFVLIGFLFMIALLSGCDENGPSVTSKPNVHANKAQGVNEIEWLTNNDKALLKSTDIYDVRMAISKIANLKSVDVTGYLVDLWDDRGVLSEEVNEDSVKHPVVRLTLAQSIIQKGVVDREYSDYIISHVNSDDRIVRTVASEALRDIYSEEALRLLRKIAESDDAKIAEIAISGIKHQTVFGENRELAKSLWEELEVSNTRYKDIMAEYDQMYDKYLQERERRIKEGFVPAE